MTWIATSEQLPDDEMLVLVALEDGEVWPAFLDGDDWRYASADPIGVRVTHWMDLPEAPK